MSFAAVSQVPPVLRMVDIRGLPAGKLDPMLAEEISEWKTELDWDFSGAAALIRRLAGERRLGGVALIDDVQVAGCGLAAVESEKGVIVDLYVRRRWRTEDAEGRLFRALAGALMATPGVGRIEGQLMLGSTASALRGVPLRPFVRLLMKRDTAFPLPPGRSATPRELEIGPWNDSHFDAAARLLTLAHAGHIDREISDQYRSTTGAARLLRNIVHFGSGETFCQAASFAAFDTATRSLAGLSLASFVADGVGHIGELCVAARWRFRGLGYELLRRSVAALRDAGADRVCLTVTAANERAVGFYAQCGFRTARRFNAYVWEREDPCRRPISACA